MGCVVSLKKSNSLFGTECYNGLSVAIFQISYFGNVIKFFSDWSTTNYQGFKYCCNLRTSYIKNNYHTKIHNKILIPFMRQIFCLMTQSQ